MPAPVNRIGVPTVDGWLARAGRALWPPRCLVCGEPGAHGRDLCAACTAALPWNPHACPTCAMPLPVGAAVGHTPQPCGACLRRPPPLDAARSAFVYAFPLDRLLPRFKFHRDLAAGRLLVQAMAAAFGPLAAPDALLPVPLHRSRLRSRGYDQALELARPLAQALSIPLRGDLLRRTRATAPQSRLDARDRQRNLRGAFRVPAGSALPVHVALVDDVLTTGATLHAAALALRQAGVARVEAWVCARVP